MKTKKVLIIVGVIISVFLVLFIIKSNNGYEFISNEQIHDWTKVNNIEILEMVEVTDEEKKYTILFYKQENKIGNYMIYKVNKESIFNKQIETDLNKEQPLQYISVTTGVPYISIYINDKSLLEKSTVIEANIGDKTFAKSVKSTKSHYIISTENGIPNNNLDFSLTLYDKSNKVLYQNE